MRPPSPGDCPAFVKAAPREEGLHKLVASQATDNAQDSSGQHTVPGGGELPSVPANKETSTNIQHVASEITAVKENVTAIDSTNNKNSDDQNKETSKNNGEIEHKSAELSRQSAELRKPPASPATDTAQA